MALCFGCKVDVETHSIAVQTECTEGGEADVICFLSPGSSFCGKKWEQAVKVQQSLGDCDGGTELFEENELSSIEESNSSHALSFLQSFVEDENLISSPVYKDSDNSIFENWSKKFLSPQGNTKNSFKFNNTMPRPTKFETDIEEIDKSYEKMIDSLGCTQTEGLKQSFIQLIQVEKISLRLQIQRKKYLSGKF